MDGHGGRREGSGRKRLPETEKLVTKSVQVSPRVWLAIEREAERLGRTKGAVIRQMLEDGVKRIQKGGA